MTKYNDIYIYNLENGNLLKKYYLGDNLKLRGEFIHWNNLEFRGEFIHWNDRFVIFVNDLLLKILDLKIYKIITVIHTIGDLYYIKKINHQIYGESLLISSVENKGINLWTI